MKRLFAIALVVLFAAPLFAQDDAMPAFVMFGLRPSPDPTDPNTYGVGCPVHVYDHSTYGGAQVLPNFVEIEVADATVAQIRNAYVIPWHKFLDWEFVSHDYPTDTHSLKTFVRRDLVSASGLNRMTREAVEQFLDSWGATVASITLGEVNFVASVFSAIESDGFWQMDVSGGVFTETAYDQTTGLHTVRVTYGAIPGANQNNVAAKIVSRGCTVVGNQPAQQRMTFTCSRDNVFSLFKESVKEQFDGQYSPYRWRLTQEGIDALVAAGGRLQLTKAQAIAYLRNRLDD